MKLVLHIGNHKTGTSSIQRTLHRSRESLLEKGIHYPKCAGFDRHSILAVPFETSGVPREFWRRLGKNRNKVVRLAMEAWETIGQEVEGADRVVLSGEEFIKIDDGAALERTIARVFPSVADVEVVCYLRHPCEWYPSALQQAVKASSKLPAALHRKVAPALAKFEGVGKITIREYSRSQLAGGDVVQDFLEHFVGIDFERPILEENIGLSAEGTSLLQGYRAAAFPDQDNHFNARTKLLIERIREAEAELGGRNFFGSLRLRPEYAAKIRALATPDLREISDRYGFRFHDPDLYGENPPVDTPYSSKMRVGDVLVVEPDKLERLAAHVIAASV